MSGRPELFAAEIGGAAIRLRCTCDVGGPAADQGSPVYSAIGIGGLAHVDIEGMVIEYVFGSFDAI